MAVVAPGLPQTGPHQASKMTGVLSSPRIRTRLSRTCPTAQSIGRIVDPRARCSSTSGATTRTLARSRSYRSSMGAWTAHGDGTAVMRQGRGHFTASIASPSVMTPMYSWSKERRLRMRLSCFCRIGSSSPGRADAKPSPTPTFRLSPRGGSGFGPTRTVRSIRPITLRPDLKSLAPSSLARGRWSVWRRFWLRSVWPRSRSLNHLCRTMARMVGISLTLPAKDGPGAKLSDG